MINSKVFDAFPPSPLLNKKLFSSSFFLLKLFHKPILIAIGNISVIFELKARGDILSIKIDEYNFFKPFNEQIVEI